MIIEAVYASPENDQAKVTYNDGRELFVPLVEGNRHYQELTAWVGEGNAIDPYVEPEVPVEQQIVNDLADEGVTVNTLTLALTAQEMYGDNTLSEARKASIAKVAEKYQLTPQQVLEAI